MTTESTHQHDLTFEVLSAGTVGLREGLFRLAAGTCAAVRWPGLLPHDIVGIAREVGEDGFEPYDEKRLSPPILKVGPALYDYYTSTSVDDSYWQHAQRAAVALRQVFHGYDPIAQIMSRLQAELGIPVRPASVGGRPLHVGILREFTSGSKIHYDEVVREYPGNLDEEPIVQLAFNLYLALPGDGGALTVWKHRWVPHDDEFREGYGWRCEAVANIPAATLHTDIGEAVFFDCRNFHAVSDFVDGRRITLSFFCGFTMTGELIVWS